MKRVFLKYTFYAVCTSLLVVNILNAAELPQKEYEDAILKKADDLADCMLWAGLPPELDTEENRNVLVMSVDIRAKREKLEQQNLVSAEECDENYFEQEKSSKKVTFDIPSDKSKDVAKFYGQDFLSTCFDATKKSVFVAGHGIVLEHPKGLARVVLCYKNADLNVLQSSKIELTKKTWCGLFTESDDYIECIFKNGKFSQCNKCIAARATEGKVSNYYTEEKALEVLNDFVDKYATHVKAYEKQRFARIGSLQEWFFPVVSKDE